ncbi:MAG: tetratricopeptide repeat protein [Terriglobia bacterium]
MLAALIAAFITPGAGAQNRGQPSVASALDNTAEVHLARGHEAFKDHRYQQAEREFRAALALDPRLTVQARFPLAVALFELQEHDEARQQFEIVRSKTGDDPNVNYYLGRLDLMDGNLNSAIHNLTIAASKPPFPDTAYYLGYAFFKKNDFNSAEKWLKTAAKLAPRDARVHEHLGLLYQVMGRKEQAENALALASELRRQDITATQQAIDCDHSLDSKPLDEARAVCQKLINPNDVGSLISLGMLYGQHHDYADAVAPFQLAAKLDPDSYEMQYNLGLTYFRLKRYADARQPLEKAVALRPDLFEVNAPLGAVLYALGDDPEAYRVLDHANRLNPQNADVSLLLCKVALNLASASNQAHRTPQARAYLLRASEAQPDDPEPHRRLAQVYESLGDNKDAQHERDLAGRLSSH